MKVELIGYNRRSSTFEPFKNLVFKVIYKGVRTNKVIHYWREDNVIQKEVFEDSYELESCPASMEVENSDDTN